MASANPFWLWRQSPSAPMAVAISGLPTRIPVRHSNISDSPAPLAPPSGVRNRAASASVVGSPSPVSATPGSSCVPLSRARITWPIEPVDVAMSSRIGSRSMPGAAIAIGLVATPRARAP